MKSELHSRNRHKETAKIPSKPPTKKDEKIFIVVVAIIIFVVIPVMCILFI